MLTWWGLQVLSQQGTAIGERGILAMQRASYQAEREVWEAYTGVLHRWNADSTVVEDVILAKELDPGARHCGLLGRLLERVRLPPVVRLCLVHR